MNETYLISVHEARVTHHVAAVSQVNRQYSATPILNRTRTMIVELLIAVGLDITTGKHVLNVREKLGIDRHHVLKVPMYRTILHHPNLAIAFDDLSLDFTNLFVDKHRDVFLAAQDLFPRLDHAIRA